MTAASCEEVLARIDEPPLRAQSNTAQENRRGGARRLLRWLQTFPGTTWQQRWQASPATALGAQWIQAPAAWLTEQSKTPLPAELRAGLLCLSVADAIRPDLDFLLSTVRSGHWHKALSAHRDPAGFARLLSVSDQDLLVSQGGRVALGQIATIIIAKGGGVADITVGDCLELRKAEIDLAKRRRSNRFLFYSLLKELGLFPPDAPATLRSFTVFSGQLTPEQLIDRYKLECQPVRDLLVDYLTERQPALDYVSLRGLVNVLARHFWKNLETHHPGIDSLRLPRDVATAWKQRLRTKVTRRRLPDGTVAEVTSPRDSYLDILSKVRGFYLDIAEWALDEPARWGPWAATSPVSGNEISYKKRNSRRKAKMDQRTRERLPVLPTLVGTAEQRLRDARTRLQAVRAVSAGGTFTVLGDIFVKTANRDNADPDSTVCVYDDKGRRRDLGLEEHRAFFGWAAIEFLRNTGVRIEEMLETSHYSITQYRLPTTGELIPLLQIAPSKTMRNGCWLLGRSWPTSSARSSVASGARPARSR